MGAEEWSPATRLPARYDHRNLESDSDLGVKHRWGVDVGASTYELSAKCQLPIPDF